MKQRKIALVVGILAVAIIAVSISVARTEATTRKPVQGEGTCSAVPTPANAAAPGTDPLQRTPGFCKNSFCWDVGVKCVNTSGTCSGGVGSCGYTKQNDSSCTAADPLPSCFTACG